MNGTIFTLVIILYVTIIDSKMTHGSFIGNGFSDKTQDDMCRSQCLFLGQRGVVLCGNQVIKYINISY